LSLFPDGAGQVASSWVPLRDEGEQRGAASSFLPYSRPCPALHSKVPEQSTFFCCVHQRVRSSRSWLFSEIISATRLVGELVYRGGPAGMRRTEKNPVSAISPLIQRLSTVAIF